MTTIEDVKTYGKLKRVDCDSGWHPIVIKLHEDILKIDPSYTLTQIKEKFGTLRYYIMTESPAVGRIYALIKEAEFEAEHTCEMCGGQDAALRRNIFWWKTLCDSCDAVAIHVV
jgi:hypothetical protein